MGYLEVRINIDYIHKPRRETNLGVAQELAHRWVDID